MKLPYHHITGIETELRTLNKKIDEMPTWVKTEKVQVTDVSHPNNDVFDINT